MQPTHIQFFLGLTLLCSGTSMAMEKLSFGPEFGVKAMQIQKEVNDSLVTVEGIVSCQRSPIYSRNCQTQVYDSKSGKSFTLQGKGEIFGNDNTAERRFKIVGHLMDSETIRVQSANPL